MICGFSKANAQEALAPLDTLARFAQKTAMEVDKIKKLKITGYIQAQYQIADTAGITSFAAGNFPATSNNRFSIRRGRLKLVYEPNYLSNLQFQIDLTERGLVVMDAFYRITDPFIKSISLTAGIHDRPYGYEISFSSSNRETPERSRLFQTILPSERDLGAKLTFQAPKGNPWNVLKFDIGLYNGTGLIGSDFDNKKDLISHLAYNKTNQNGAVSYGLGASFYHGGVRQATRNIFSDLHTDGNGLAKFYIDSASSNINKYALRQYWGFDGQITFKNPLGFTTLRAEYIAGTQPGTSIATRSPSVDPNTDTYIRNFDGAYLYFIQSIGAKHKIMVKYDWYDPNTKIAGSSIGKSGSYTTKTDIKYNTLGLGYLFNYDANVKFIAYYDIVKNEISDNVKDYKKDLKDNVWTFRIQYRF